MVKEYSLIIPTCGRDNILEKSLDVLVKQVGSDGEVVVVFDGGMSTGLNAARNENVKFLRQKHSGPAAARNLAIKKSQGKVLIFVNDDTRVGKEFIKKHLNFHKKNPKIDRAVVGMMKELYGAFSRESNWLINHSGLHFDYSKATIRNCPWYYLWTCNFSLKKEFLIKKDLFFDETFPVAAWEDIEFAYRARLAGLNLSFDRLIIGYHDHKFDFDGIWKRFYGHGIGLWHIREKLPRKYLPPLARWEIRLAANIFLNLSGYYFWGETVKGIIKSVKWAPNWLMQLLVIGEKMKGYDYEKNRLAKSTNK